MKKLGIVAMSVALLGHGAVAQALSYDTVGADYLENFNALIMSGSGTLTGRGPHAFDAANLGALAGGWYFSNPLGSSSNTEYRAQDGSLSGSAGRGVVSFGLTDDSDRSLGALSTSNQIGRFGLVLQNTTGAVLDEFSLSYHGEYWRNGGDSLTSTLHFSYATFAASPSIDGSDFVDVAALNYAVTASGAAGAVDGNTNFTSISSTVNGFVWNPGEYLVIRWTSEDLTGQDNGLAVDDLSFSAVPEPATVALMALALGTLVIWRSVRRVS